MSVEPKHEFRMQVICSVKCDKVRVTKEVELLRNHGVRLTTVSIEHMELDDLDKSKIIVSKS